jgi:hypothetical protein
MNMNKPEDYYERLAQEFKKSKEGIEALTKRQNEMKAELIEALQANGYEDDKGHKWYKVGSIELKYERRVSRSFNAEAAEQWAREHGLWEDLRKVVEVLDEDKLLGYAWNHKDEEETIQGFYTEKETWAFKA